MRTVLFFIIVAVCPCLLKAQESSSFALADSTRMEKVSGSRSFCSPGILNKSRSRGIDIAYNFLNGGTIRPEENQLADRPGQLESLVSLIAKIKVPLVNKPGFKLLAGFSYRPETYTFSTIPVASAFSIASPNVSDVFQDIDTRYLKSTALGLYALKPLDDSHYLGFRFRLAYNGDYNGLMKFDNRYASYQATMAYGIKKHEDLEYGFGVAFSKNFRRTIALPFIIYNRNFNDKWGLETVFPAYVNGRYNINKKSILLFGYEYNTRAYSVDIENRYTGIESEYHLRHAEFLLGASIERQIVPWVWMNVKAGYQINLNTNFDAQMPGLQSFQARPSNAPYLRMGVFISPPDRLFK